MSVLTLLQQYKAGDGCTWLAVPVLCLSAGGVALGGGLAAMVYAQPSAWATWLSLGLGVCSVGFGGWQLRRTLWPLLQVMQQARQRSPRDWRPLALPPGAGPALRAFVHEANARLAQLRAQDESQQRFVADAAHQLRTPLAALQVQVEAWVLQAQHQVHAVPCGGVDGEQAEAPGLYLPLQQLLDLRQSTRRTTQLAHQLLTLSRVDSGLRQRGASERTDMASMAADLLEQFWAAAQAKNIDLGLEVETCFVNGQHWLLREMWGNLLDNALKYTPAGGHVTLRCGVLMGAAGLRHSWLQVEDDGPGLAPEHREQVLQRFYRVPGTAGDGSGLGLAIAAEIAQGHSAVMRLEAGAANKGLKVTVIFPE